MRMSFSSPYFHLFQFLLNVVVVIGTATVGHSVQCPCEPNCNCSSPTYNEYFETTCCVSCNSVISYSAKVVYVRNDSSNDICELSMRNRINLTGDDYAYSSPENVTNMPSAEVSGSDLHCAVKLCRACEHTNVTLECSGGKIIKVCSANYGRTEHCVCGNYDNTDCRAPNSFNKVSDQCNGKRVCRVPASNTFFGDPCEGTFKYLDVSYECQTNEGDATSSVPPYTVGSTNTFKTTVSDLSTPSTLEVETSISATTYSITREIMSTYALTSKTTSSKPEKTTATSSTTKTTIKYSLSTPSQKDVRRGHLEKLANETIPPGQALNVAEMLSNLTSRADNFEESDVSLAIDIVSNILQSQENGKEVAVARGVLQTVDNLLSVGNDVLLASQENHNSATRLLQSVERLSRLIESDNGSVTIEILNILLTVAEVNVTGFKGLSFPVSTFSQSKTFNGSSDFTRDIETSIELPSSLFEHVDDSDKFHASNAQFLVYWSNKFFQVVDNRTLAGFSPVIAASIGELTIANLREPVKIRLAKNASYRNANESCVFWDFYLNAGSGAWSGEGCAISPEENDNNSVLCECDHLTNFALLVDIYNEGTNINSPNKKALSIISYVGCIVSVISLAMTLVSLIAYKKTKDKATKILLNLCFALFMAMTMFLIGSFSTDFVPIIPELCTTVAVLLHYFLLAVLAWMALEAVLLYLQLVKVFKTYIRRFMMKFCLIGWGVPLAVVGITLTIDLNNYGYNNTICWLSRYPFYGAFLTPLCLVLIFNSIIYCLVIYQICGLNSKAMTANERYSYLAQLRAAIGLMVVLGLTWVFAFFAVGQASLMFNYLFAIFNSLQGLFIFLFHCAMKTEIKTGWKKTFCRCMVARHREAGHGDTDAWTNSSNDSKYEINNAEEMDIKLDASTASVEQMDRDNEQTMSTFKGHSAQND